MPAFVAGSEVQRVKSLFESCARSRAGLILSILRCGVGLTRADSLLRVCGGGGWRLPSSAGSRGQGRLGDVSGLDRPLLSTFPSLDLRLSAELYCIVEDCQLAGAWWFLSGVVKCMESWPVRGGSSVGL